mmetsp:Transcript_32692/g.68843  ORF Transcript_32692/g.68843 Transcript_32692/m.68843 type:complete len:245 (-) Transcript_32692:215-949(-)|eukprot:6189444-Pleurochrysis_carterae.AAC.1
MCEATERVAEAPAAFVEQRERPPQSRVAACIGQGRGVRHRCAKLEEREQALFALLMHSSVDVACSLSLAVSEVADVASFASISASASAASPVTIPIPFAAFSAFSAAGVATIAEWQLATQLLPARGISVDTARVVATIIITMPISRTMASSASLRLERPATALPSAVGSVDVGSSIRREACVWITTVIATSTTSASKGSPITITITITISMTITIPRRRSIDVCLCAPSEREEHRSHECRRRLL